MESPCQGRDVQSGTSALRCAAVGRAHTKIRAQKRQGLEANFPCMSTRLPHERMEPWGLAPMQVQPVQRTGVCKYMRDPRAPLTPRASDTTHCHNIVTRGPAGDSGDRVGKLGGYKKGGHARGILQLQPGVSGWRPQDWAWCAPFRLVECSGASQGYQGEGEVLRDALPTHPQHMLLTRGPSRWVAPAAG